MIVIMTPLLVITSFFLLLVGQAWLEETIDPEDAKYLLNQIKAGKLLMASPLDMKGDWMGFIVPDKTNTSKARLYNMSASLLKKEGFNLAAAGKSKDLETVWPRLFGNPTSSTTTANWAVDKVFPKWLAADKVANMIIYRSPSLHDDLYLIVSHKEGQTDERLHGLRYRLNWKEATFKLNAIQIAITYKKRQLIFDSPSKQGTWIGMGNNMKGKVSIMSTGIVTGKWMVYPMEDISTFEANDMVRFDAPKRAQLCIDAQNGKINHIPFESTCQTNGGHQVLTKRSLTATNGPLPSIYCAIATKEGAFLFAKDALYFINKPDFYSSGSPTFIKLPYDTFVRLPKKRGPAAKVSSGASAQFDSKGKPSTVPSTTRSNRVLYIIVGIVCSIVAVAIIFAAIFCFNCCPCIASKEEKSAKPKEADHKPGTSGYKKNKKELSSKKNSPKVASFGKVPVIAAPLPKSKVCAAPSVATASVSTATSRSVASNIHAYKISKKNNSKSVTKSTAGKGKSCTSLAKSTLSAKSKMPKKSISKGTMGSYANSLASLGALPKSRAGSSTMAASAAGAAKCKTKK